MDKINEEKEKKLKNQLKISLINIKTKIKEELSGLIGKPVQVVKETILNIMKVEGLTPEKLAKLSKKFSIKKITSEGNIFDSSLTNEIDTIAQKISNGKDISSQDKENIKDAKLLHIQLQNERIIKLPKEQALVEIEEAIRTAATAKGFTEEQLQKPMTAMSYDTGTRINTNGKPFIKAASEIVYNATMAMYKGMSPNQIKQETENNLGVSKREKTTEPQNLIDGMVNGDDGSVKQNPDNTIQMGL